MNFPAPTQTDSATTRWGSDTTFTIPFRHLRPSRFSGQVNQTSISPTGMSSFVGDQPNAVLSCLTSLLDFPNQGPHIWPMVFFGASGTGKTSLAMSLLTEIANRSEVSSLFLTATEFYRRYLFSLENNTASEFLDSFVNAPGIFIDDVHKIVDKNQAQNVLAALIDQSASLNQPILLTIDQFPGASSLVPRLASRLTAGTCLPVKPPGKSARRVIVTKLAHQYQIALSAPAIDAIVDTFPVAVPNLGHFFAQLQLNIRSKYGKQSPTIDIDLLREFTKPSPLQLEELSEQITHAVAMAFQIKTSDMKSNRRHQSIVAARNVAIYLQRSLLGLSFNRIGVNFGNRDHATIMHAFKKMTLIIDSKNEKEATIRKMVIRLSKQLSEQLINLQWKRPVNSTISKHSP